MMGEAKWRTMESATKDGSPVLAWVHDETYPMHQPYHVVTWHNGAWTREGDDYNIYVEPTRWMPLPEPPTA